MSRPSEQLSNRLFWTAQSHFFLDSPRTATLKTNYDQTIRDNNFEKISYYDNNALAPKWVTLCAGLTNNRCVKKKYFSLGTHNLDIQVTDKAGNSAKQSIAFTI